MYKTKEKWLYLPIDIKVRELHSKTLIAAEAVARGYKVVLGRKSEVSSVIGSLPKGVFVGFGAHKNFKEQYQALKSVGHSVVALDEEGLLTFSEDMFKKSRLSEETLSNTDAVLTWGSHHSDMVKSFCREKRITTNIVTTGNARFDILSPKFQHLLDEKTNAIKEKHGSYFLIVSSFGSCNHYDGRDKYTQALIDKKIIQTKEDSIFYENYFNLKQDNLNTLCDLIPEIVKEYPSHKIIIRPHPSEDHSLWEKFSRHSDRISIIFDGNIHPWILGADAIMHHFCTTALESYVCGIPSIAIRSTKNNSIETPLPYNCSYEANDVSSLKLCIEDILYNESKMLKDKRSRYKEYYNQFISNVETMDAYKQIIDVIDMHCPVNKPSASLHKLKIKSWIKSTLGQNKLPQNHNSYQSQKFSCLDKSEVQNIINQLGQLNNDFRNIRIQNINNHCVILHL